MRRAAWLCLLLTLAAVASWGRAAPVAEEFTGKRLVEWTGKAHGMTYLRRNAVYYTADDFSFALDAGANGKWQVISREPTPFETWRMGPTYSGLKMDWSKDPEVRVVALKGVDRIPAEFPGLKLEPEKTLTVLLLFVRDGGAWKPWYVNNWFHRWSTPEEDARIAGHYLGGGALYDAYGFRDDLVAELTPKSREVSAKFPNWRCYHGRLVKADTPKGYALELLHLFARNPNSGGYDCVFGDPKELVPLSRLSPVDLPATGAVSAVKPAPATDSALADTGWWMAGGGPAHTGIAGTALALPLKLAWGVKVGKEFAGGPIAAGGRVYSGNNDGRIYAFEAATGKQLWNFATGAEVEATPTLSGGLVLCGSFDGKLYALDAETGKERWHFQTGPRLAGFEGIEDVKQGVDSSAAVVGGRAYFGAWDGKVYCLEVASGQLLWSHQTAGIVHWSSPAVAEGKVVLGTTDGVLHCLEAATGKALWTQTLAGRHSDHMMSGPTVAGDTVFTGGGYENGFYALSLADGRKLWQFAARNLVCCSPAVDDTRVYGLTDGAGQVFALDRATGKESWTRAFGNGWGACNPVLSGKTLFVTLREGTESGKPVALVALDTETGKTLWSHAEGSAWAGPAAAHGMLFYGSDDGTLRAFGSGP